MSDDLLYKKAVKEMKNLAEDVLADIELFADNHHYEREWVLDRFQAEFAKMVRKWKCSD